MGAASNVTVQFADGTTTSTILVPAGHDLEYLALLGGDAVLLLDRRLSDSYSRLTFYSLLNSMGDVIVNSIIGTHLERPVVLSSIDGDGAFLVYYEQPKLTPPNPIFAEIYREDTGAKLCSPGVGLTYPANHPIESMAINATPAWLIHSWAPGPWGGPPTFSCHLRDLALSTPLVGFPATPVGTVPSPTATVRITNTGKDCMTISDIQDVAPFSLSPSSPALPADLAAGGFIDVILEFTPTSVGPFSESLPIVGLTHSGATDIPCTGEGTMSAAKDFYVRDWTDNPTSGDDGAEPSSKTVFYKTCDVWNRRSTNPGSFPNDQPENEDAGNGAGSTGDNWAFARIRRNVLPATGTETVTVHFLVSKFGTGSAFVDASVSDPGVSFLDPDPTVTFSHTETGPKITPAYQWHLDDTVSSHLCLAVEISTPDDPYIAPSLVGNTPGWPSTDLMLTNDNNKAQRNMGQSTSPAAGADESADAFAIAHSAATTARDMVLRYEVAPDIARRLRNASVGVVGGQSKPLKSGDKLVLKNMLPGENRWIRLSFNPPQGKEGELLPVDFFEMVGGTAINGFSIAPRLSSPALVIHDRLESHHSVFTRMVAGFDVDEAEETAAASKGMLKKDDITEQDYLTFLRPQLRTIDACCRVILKRRGVEDVFDVKASLERLTSGVQTGTFDSASVAHGSLLNKLDSFLTMLQLSNGDPADVLLMVRWQAELYTNLTPLRQLNCAQSVVQESDQFIVAYGMRKATNRDYPALIRRLMSCFTETGKSAHLKRLRLEKEIADIENNLDDVTALQKAHRAFLLKLYKLDK